MGRSGPRGQGEAEAAARAGPGRRLPSRWQEQRGEGKGPRTMHPQGTRGHLRQAPVPHPPAPPPSRAVPALATPPSPRRSCLSPGASGNPRPQPSRHQDAAGWPLLGPNCDKRRCRACGPGVGIHAGGWGGGPLFWPVAAHRRRLLSAQLLPHPRCISRTPRSPQVKAWSPASGPWGCGNFKGRGLAGGLYVTGRVLARLVAHRLPRSSSLSLWCGSSFAPPGDSAGMSCHGPKMRGHSIMDRNVQDPGHNSLFPRLSYQLK